jgi:hypothetical protein
VLVGKKEWKEDEGMGYNEITIERDKKLRNVSSDLSRRNDVKCEEQDRASGFVSSQLPVTTVRVKHWNHTYCRSTGESEREKLQIEI